MSAAADGERLLYTFAGVGITVGLTQLLANPLQKRRPAGAAPAAT